MVNLNDDFAELVREVRRTFAGREPHRKKAMFLSLSLTPQTVDQIRKISRYGPSTVRTLLKRWIKRGLVQGKTLEHGVIGYTLTDIGITVRDAL